MARLAVALALMALLGLCVGARVPFDVMQSVDEGFPSLAAFQGSFTGMQGGFGTFWRNLVGRGGGKREMEEPAYVALRFVVPPSVSKDFEDAWLKLERKAVDKESGLQILDLKTTKLDNIFYLAYGEWDTKMDLHTHIKSKYFEDFAEFVDKYGIRWQLELLENVSEEIEEEQERIRANIPEGQKRVHGVSRRRRMSEEDMAHVLFLYIVPTDTKEDFVGAWKDAAFKTIKEDGNRIMSLRKLVTDNTRFYGYGTWESIEDLQDHLESKHVGRLLEFYDDQDIVYFALPLLKVGTQSE